MIGWAIFHKALDINEDIINPTYYELLDIDPESCNEALVDKQLKVQKIKLRQNIPNQQFIPLILTFEKTKLEHAAMILRDPQTRRKYDRYLHRKEHEKKFREHKEKTHHRLSAAFRMILDDMLNPDKTLDESKRPELEAKLRKLRLKQDKINKIMDRIPAPAQTTASPGDEVIDYFAMSVELIIDGREVTAQTRQKIIALAQKLSIPSAKAEEILASKVKNTNDQLQAHAYSVSDTTETGRPDEQETLPYYEDDDTSMAMSHLWSIGKIAVPIISISMFALIVWFFQYGKSPEDSTPLQQTAQNDSVQTGVNVAPNTPSQLEPAPKEDDSLSLNDQEVAARSFPDSNLAGPPKVTPDESDSSSETATLLITPEQMREVFFIGGQDEGVLTDVASLMLLSYSRLLQYHDGKGWPEDEIRSRLEMTSTEKQEWFVEKVRIFPLPTTAIKTSPQDDEIDYEECSIEELMERDDKEAVKEMFSRFGKARRPKKNASKAEINRTARILYCLARMSDQDIPRKLADLIPQNGGCFAYLIVKTLADVANTSAHRLPFISTEKERNSCAGWWKRNIPTWGNFTGTARSTLSRSGRNIASRITGTRRSSPTRSRSMRITPSSPPSLPAKSPARDSSSWLADTHKNNLALLAVVQDYGGVIAEVIDSNQNKSLDINKRRERLVTQPDRYCYPAEIGNELLTTFEQIYGNLRTYIEDADENIKDETSMVERRRWGRDEMCRTFLQEVFVYNEAIGELFFLLVRSRLTESDSLEHLQTMQNEHKENVQNEYNILYQLRESIYYQYALLHQLVSSSCTMPTAKSQNNGRITR